MRVKKHRPAKGLYVTNARYTNREITLSLSSGIITPDKTSLKEILKRLKGG